VEPVGASDNELALVVQDFCSGVAQLQAPGELAWI
jgi:hypothetical protein